MSARSYKLISALLGFCVLSILVLQAFWIRNFYVQKTDELNKTVYAALEKVTAKLQERDNVRLFSETMVLLDGDTIIRPENNKPPRYVTTYGKKRGGGKKPFTRQINLKKGNVTSVLVTDTVFEDATKGNYINKSIVTVYKDQKQVLKRETKSNRVEVFSIDTAKVKKQISEAGRVVQESVTVLDHAENTLEKAGDGVNELGQLVNKMMAEIKFLHKEEKNQDTIKTVIRKALESKGIFIPFEFSMRKVGKDKTDILAQSEGFKELENYYSADLSVNKVFDTHNFLWLQLQGQSGLVMAGMKGSLLLSILFSLIIISSFYYTLRLILRQKKLSEIKNDFVNNMTHELKTPIATISLALDAINNPQVKNNEERFKDYTRILKEENKKLNDHVERVLQMALLEKGELQLNKQPLDLVSLIESSIDAYKLQISEQKAEVYFIPPTDKIILQGDELHLQTVFNNLLDNALKYSSGNCILTISVVKNGNEVVVSFRDNGIGIDNDQKEKIFDKFYRVQGGNLHDVKGFGLGLSYVKSIVEAHEGSIEVKSEKGRGSEFSVQFRIV